jgi:hypothetical protein
MLGFRPLLAGRGGMRRRNQNQNRLMTEPPVTFSRDLFSVGKRRQARKSRCNKVKVL